MKSPFGVFSFRRFSSFFAASALLCLSGAAFPVRAADWPQWRGPNRDRISAETGWTAAWQAGDDPQSYGSPLLFTCEGKDCVAFFNTAGLVVREAANGAELMRFPWKTMYDINPTTPIVADGKLLIQAENGALVVAEASPEAYKAIARTQAVPNKTWVIPVLANGKIFCRNNNGEAVCLDVSGS